jgi:large subunit ribosomal protein L29
MKAIDLRKKKTDELKKMVVDLKKESFNLRFQRVSSQLTNTARVREVRRTIARIKTLLNTESMDKAKK